MSINTTVMATNGYWGSIVGVPTTALATFGYWGSQQISPFVSEKGIELSTTKPYIELSTTKPYLKLVTQ